jgi:hypothetical protein
MNRHRSNGVGSGGEQELHSSALFYFEVALRKQSEKEREEHLGLMRRFGLW